MGSILIRNPRSWYAIWCGQKKKSNNLSFACSLTTWQSRQDVQAKDWKYISDHFPNFCLEYKRMWLRRADLEPEERSSHLRELLTHSEWQFLPPEYWMSGLTLTSSLLTELQQKPFGGLDSYLSPVLTELTGERTEGNWWKCAEALLGINCGPSERTS